MKRMDPVIIIGAPRSGTSLLQKIVRECDGFRSVAKESDFIWQPYTHPENNDWSFEGWNGRQITREEKASFHFRFDEYAVPASVWRRSNAIGVQRLQKSRLFRPVLKAGYKAFASVTNRIRSASSHSAEPLRIVDKSVHAPLFLDLVQQVFPDARFIHITRRSASAVPSMISGWLNPQRFFTYELPGGLQIPDYPFDQWNFALPRGWEELRSHPLAEVVCFQWMAIQRATLGHFRKTGAPPVLRVSLERLALKPGEEFEKIARFIDGPDSSRLQLGSAGLPRVNARPDSEHRRMADEIETRMARIDSSLRDQLNAVDRELGYT